MKERIRSYLIRSLFNKFSRDYGFYRAEFDLPDSETKKAKRIDTPWKEWLVDHLAVFFSGIKPRRLSKDGKPFVGGFIDYGRKIVVVNEELPEDQKQYTGWHEFFHWVLEMVLVFFRVSRFIKKGEPSVESHQ